jgi:FAD:protein FMN transferase
VIRHAAALLLALLPVLGRAVPGWCQAVPRTDAPLVQVTRAWPVMGTMLVVTVWATDTSRVSSALLAARDSVRLVDSLMSTYRSSSDLSRLDAAAGAPEPVRVARQTMTVLLKARLYWRLSGGAFDPTVGPMVRAWGFEQTRARRPTGRALDSLRRLVDFSAVELDSVHSTARLPRAGMRLDLGGIAKGFALDMARRALRDAAICAGKLDLGGNLLLFGRPPGGGPWRVEIVDPLRRERVVGGFTLDSGAVATSGNYEHYVVVKGRRYGHLIDPRTGEPARGVLSATAIGPSGEWSDGLSATLFLLGPRRGARLADSLPSVAAIWILDRGQKRPAMRDLVCSSRIAPRFTFELRSAGAAAERCPGRPAHAGS